MTTMFPRTLAKIFGSSLIPVLLVGDAFAGTHKNHPYRYSIIDIPVSLATGTVRTPPFTVAKTHWYWILIQVEKPLPFQQMQCMMGVTASPLDRKDCSENDPLLRADWSVWNDGHLMSSGSSTPKDDGMFTKEYIFKFLGGFPAETGKKYMLEVNFNRDGTPLNVANPHLIVVKQGEE